MVADQYLEYDVSNGNGIFSLASKYKGRFENWSNAVSEKAKILTKNYSFGRF